MSIQLTTDQVSLRTASKLAVKVTLQIEEVSETSSEGGDNPPSAAAFGHDPIALLGRM
jgi:hypothetical protein